MVELLLQWGADTRYRTVLGDTAVTVAQVAAHSCFKKFHPKVRNHGEGPY